MNESQKEIQSLDVKSIQAKWMISFLKLQIQLHTDKHTHTHICHNQIKDDYKVVFMVLLLEMHHHQWKHPFQEVIKFGVTVFSVCFFKINKNSIEWNMSTTVEPPPVGPLVETVQCWYPMLQLIFDSQQSPWVVCKSDTIKVKHVDCINPLKC